MMQDLNDLYYFAQVVEKGGISAAARMLGIPKSRLSRRLALLEEQLGVRLIQRSTRRFNVTELGRLYYRHCAALVAEAQAAQAVIDHVQAEPRGLVRVSCPVVMSQDMLTHLLPRFLATCSRVQVQLKATDRRVDLLEEGIDVALRVQFRPQEEANLIVRPLGRSSHALLASPMLLEAVGRPQTPAELARLPAIGMDYADGRHIWHLTAADGSEHPVVYQPRLITDDILVLKRMAVARVGVVELPEYLCREELARGELEIVLPQYSMPGGTVQAVYASRRGLVSAVRAFIDFLVAELPPLLACYHAGALVDERTAAPLQATRRRQ
ncbi:MAG TPA: LysR substrate-binding domain-containing protein [Candidatus Competibacteraceae bacterium]|nr:LysR substrate-binding domain-containing protein [Candidatus Competibacteraceae bacterium]